MNRNQETSKQTNQEFSSEIPLKYDIGETYYGCDVTPIVVRVRASSLATSNIVGVCSFGGLLLLHS